MNVYESLFTFLQCQDKYEIEINREDAENKPGNIQDILDSYEIILIPKKPRNTRSMSLSDYDRVFNEYINKIEKWIEKNTGLKPSHKRRFEHQRGDEIYPELTYTQDLPESDINVTYRNHQDEVKVLRFKGKNRLEIKILGLFPD